MTEDKKYIIFANDFMQYYGGVTDYIDNFATQLQSNNRLKFVLTPYKIDTETPYEIRQFKIDPFRRSSFMDKWALTSKVSTLFYYLRLYYSCFKGLMKLKDEDAEIIFMDYYTHFVDILIFCAGILNFRFGITMHGLDIIFSKKRKFIHVKSNVQRADFLMFCSSATKDLFVRTHNLHPKTYLVLHPGINIKKVEQQYLKNVKIGNKPQDSNTPIFSTISRLDKRKGIDKAIDIVCSLQKDFPGIKYYIGGTGPENDYLVSLVERRNAKAFIFFLGKIDDQQKYSLLVNSDVFIMPNYSINNSDFEGFGISFIEASLCNNVIVGGSQGGVKEAVLDGKTGYLFDFDHPDAIEKCTAKIKSVLSDYEKVNKVRNNGIQYVRENFDWPILVQKFLRYSDSNYAVIK